MTARTPDAAAIRAAVQRAVDDPAAPPFVAPSEGDKSVLFHDWDESRSAFPPLDHRVLSDAGPDDAARAPLPERAALLVRDRHGVEGLRALATFMHAMGAAATLHWTDPDDEAGEPVWTPCDFVMQHADELAMESASDAGTREGGSPMRLAREARDHYRTIVESSRPSGHSNGLVVPRIPMRHWLGPALDRLCTALGVDDAGPPAGTGKGRDA